MKELEHLGIVLIIVFGSLSCMLVGAVAVCCALFMPAPEHRNPFIIPADEDKN